MKKKSEIINYLFYSIVPIIIFVILYKFSNISFSYSILASCLTLFINGIFLFLRIVFSKDSELETIKVKSLEKELFLTKTEFDNYKAQVEEYFVNWIHQIKTPLTALKLILSSEKDINSYSNRNIINEEILYIEEYTSMALSYLKVIDKEKDLDITNVSLDTIIKEVLKKYRLLFIHNKTKLNYEKIEDTVLTDANWTKIMVEQLVNNALKYSKGKTIEIYFNKEENKLYIKDTGLGIKEEDLKRIWEKGFSGFNGRLNNESSGLGLYLVKNISEKLNQRVDVTSAVNKGSAFSIEFNKEDESLKYN